MMMPVTLSSLISKKYNTTTAVTASFLLSNARAHQQQQGLRLRRRRYDYFNTYYSTLQCIIHLSSHHQGNPTQRWASNSNSWKDRRIAIAGGHGTDYDNGSIIRIKNRCMFSKTTTPTTTVTLDSSKTDSPNSSSSSSSSLLRVIEFSACSSKRPRSSGSSNKQQDNKKLHHHHHHHHGAVTVFIPDTSAMEWKKQDSSVLLLQQQPDGNVDDTLSIQQQQQQSSASSFSFSSWNDFFFHHVIRHFLPAHYPDSVGPGYARFSFYAFGASMAGSAAMVLSTQTMLLGIVGAAQTTSATTTAVVNASIMAGALNWVVKDGIGQVGGVVFASRMGQSRRFDDNPKRWRMVAAASLDAASFMEILSPMVWPSLVLPVACSANVWKNIGFLTASASRAALHQSLARAGNLADVTAKSGSQSMAAGLLGTTLGIVLSTTVLHQDPQLFILGFVVLSFFHQVGNYSSLQHVGLHHFNRHRLHLVLQHYLQQQQQIKLKQQQHHNHGDNNNNNNDDDDDDDNKLMILTPDQVAHCEVYFPLMREDDADTWLSIASGLSHIAPGGPCELNRLLDILSGESYLINISPQDEHEQRRVYLTFLEGATGENVIKGCLHAYLIRQEFDLKNTSHNDDIDPAAAQQSVFHCIESTYAETNRHFPQLLQGLHDCQWNTTTDVTNIESSTGFRLAVNKSLPRSTSN